MTAPRKTAPKKPAPQVEAESVVEGAPVEVEFEGFAVTIPTDIDYWPTRAVQAWAGNRHFDALELLLGEEKWNEFLDRYPLRKDAVGLAGEVAKSLGFGSPGN